MEKEQVKIAFPLTGRLITYNLSFINTKNLQ